jgi:hypothetical protein
MYYLQGEETVIYLIFKEQVTMHRLDAYKIYFTRSERNDSNRK